MASGIHVKLEVDDTGACPISRITESVEIQSLTVGQYDPSADATVGEFTVTDADEDAIESSLATEVYTDSSTSVYRYTQQAGDCPCLSLPDHGCPVRAVRATQGRLLLSFIVPTLETLKDIVTDVRSDHDGVTVRCLTRSATETDRCSLVSIDRSQFTDRQYDVLETAHEMGYFDAPKRANSEDIASELGIAVPTFLEHLSRAQTTLLDQVLEV